MKKKGVIIKLLITWMLVLVAIDSPAQTKLTTGKKLLYKLGTSAQLAKEQWLFQLSDDHCLFTKQKKFKEKDGAITSVFNINVPLDKVEIEPELKSYDAFFNCLGKDKCISRTWLKPDGSVMEATHTDNASLFIKNSGLATEIYDLFSYLRTLCDRSNYPGPSGVKWGDSMEAATPVLSARYEFQTEQTARNGALFHQIYQKPFAGYTTESITVGYVDNKFFEMVVIPELKPRESIAKKWYDVVNTVINKYGKPNNILLPQSIKNLEEITNERFFKDFKIFDLEIREGHWHPSATWKYKNSATINVEVTPTPLDFEIRWQFVHHDLKKLAEVRIAEHPVDDF